MIDNHLFLRALIYKISCYKLLIIKETNHYNNMCPPIPIKYSLLLFFMPCTFLMVGQAVNFSAESGLLNPVSGFTSYSDCAVDMNGDFLDDVVRVGNKGIYIDYQQKDGSFTQQFFATPVQSPPSWSICAGDLDNDGFNDLLFGNGTSVSFVKYNQSIASYFETVMPVSIFSQRSTMADIDNDGHLDAFVCHDIGQSIPFRNDGTGGMVPDYTLINTIDLPGNYAAIWTDFDNDRDIDLYISKCLGGAAPGNIARTNLLYQNNGDGTYSEIATAAGLADNSQSWSTVFEDFDNDGDFDAFIVNHDNQNLLFRNIGNGTFTDVTASSGIDANDLGAWENAAADFNNDGFIDIFSELDKELYLGNGDLTFTAQDAPITPGAIGDFNNDGFLDVLTNGLFWINQGNVENHWFKVNPFGLAGNRNGIGARVEIYGSWGVQSREVRSGQSFSPMGSLTIHFGLGQHTDVDSMTIKWPSGITTTVMGLSADTTYLVPEADCVLPFSFFENEQYELCPGDTIQLEAPVGFANYFWSDGSTEPILQVSQPGRYFYSLTDNNGCVSLSNFIEIIMAEDEPPTITANPSHRQCKGDTVILSIENGQNPMWSTGEENQSINVLKSGSYKVSIDAKCTLGKLESQPFEVNILPSTAPEATAITIGQGDSVLITAEGANCHWYDAASGGNLLHVGPNFQTPGLDGNEVYFVESHHFYPSEVQSGGKSDAAGQGGLSTQTGYLFFEAWEPFTLLSVNVYLPLGAPEGVRFVQLFSPDTLLAVKQFQVQTGWNVLDLDFEIPAGNFSLHCPLGNLFRNEGLLEFPYLIGDVGQITTSGFGDGYYYYFYDWQVRGQGFECISERVPVEVSVTATKENEHPPGIEIFPNPSDGQVLINIKNRSIENGLLRLFDTGGRELLRRELSGAQSFHLDLIGYVPGVYLIQVGQSGQVFSERIIIF